MIINSLHKFYGKYIETGRFGKSGETNRSTDIIVLSDEVYEHLIFDRQKHESVCRYPELASRSFVVGSFGKTFHATGWKVGFVLGLAKLTEEFRKVHQFVTGQHTHSNGLCRIPER
ncbi:MAG: aminotransferase class I/II-fold pyridoxal phosphate-dependent enzyme [Bacteroidales bacterium]